VLKDETGAKFVTNILEHLNRFKMPDGYLLKRLSLILLYDVGICKKGADLISSNEIGIYNILECLDTNHPPEIYSVALPLINTLLEEIQTSTFHQKVKSLVSIRI
jgi:hypothetical protein